MMSLSRSFKTEVPKAVREKFKDIEYFMINIQINIPECLEEKLFQTPTSLLNCLRSKKKHIIIELTITSDEGKVLDKISTRGNISYKSIITVQV